MRTTLPRLESVRPLHRIKVLVAARDPVFLNAATLIFRRRGFLVDAARQPTDVVARASADVPHVVVLDATGSLGWATRAASVIRASSPRVAFVLIAEGLDEPARRRLGILDKGRPLEELSVQVERAYFRLSDGD